MKSKVLLAMISLMIFFIAFTGAVSQAEDGRIIVKGGGVSLPILMIVKIPSPGLLSINHGHSFMLNPDSGKYDEIKQLTTIYKGSIIQVDDNSEVQISFKDGSRILLGPDAEIKWYKFE